MKRTTLFAAFMLATVWQTGAFAGIPEPDAILYGQIYIGKGTVSAGEDVTVRAKVQRESETHVVGEYRMRDLIDPAHGENPQAGDNFVLRIRLETAVTGSPVSDNAVEIGQTAQIYVQQAAGPEQHVADLTLSERGMVVYMSLLVCDSTPPRIHHAAGESQTRPCTGYIDPRLESDNAVDLNRGVTEVSFVFTRPVQKVGGGTPDAADFTVTQTGAGTPPTVTGVSTTDNVTFTVTLSGPPALQEWTTIIADVEDVCGNPIESAGNMGPGVAEPDRIDIAFLPGDINQDGQVTPQDLINFRQFLAGGYHNECEDIWYFDIDRDGVMPEPQDLIRFRQLLFGTPPATREWSLADLNNEQP